MGVRMTYGVRFKKICSEVFHESHKEIKADLNVFTVLYDLNKFLCNINTLKWKLTQEPWNWRSSSVLNINIWYSFVLFLIIWSFD